MQQRRLARAALAFEGALLAGGHHEGVDIEHPHRLATGEGERFADVVKFDDGGGHGTENEGIAADCQSVPVIAAGSRDRLKLAERCAAEAKTACDLRGN